MGKEHLNHYRGQINAALHHINEAIQQDWTENSIGFQESMSIENLAKTFGMSKRNFQLCFKTFTHESVGEYVKRIRNEYALQLLKEGKYNPSQIALRVGFANPPALYKFFSKEFDETPSEYKAKFLTETVAPNYQDVEYEIRKMAATPVLFLPYVGNYDDYAAEFFGDGSWDRLCNYASTHGLLPENEEDMGYWGICYDDTDFTDADKCRFYACLNIKTFVKLNLTDEIKCMSLPAQWYAVYRHIGAYNDLEAFYKAILQNIPSGYQLGEGRILERYLNSPRDVNEAELVTEVLLPIIKQK
ncbi:hypothetical protein FACS1894199_16930 [Bacteroidia bacterium]|nr:hypothetical protein FACS1894199_16930 [Bacteroidia bacterium]